MSEERSLALHDGYAIAVAEDRKLLQLTAPDGRVCLKVVLGPRGPEVEISAAALSVATDGDLSLDCDSFRVRARRGGIDLVANDDVSLKGERIRLNSPLKR